MFSNLVFRHQIVPSLHKDTPVWCDILEIVPLTFESYQSKTEGSQHEGQRKFFK